MAVYVACFKRHCDNVVNLDDIVHATVEANLATSSGHMGRAAISRSTRKDRSRDPLYNQLKMYAELFRCLGLLRSTKESALKFTFTLLGEQLVAAGRHWRPLLGEAVLGIAYPNHVIDVRSVHNVRPFAFILRTMLACNGCLSRDEIILGPLNAVSDQSPTDLDAVVTNIKQLREGPHVIKDSLDNLALDLGIQLNTMRNYTRWPLAIMRDLQWTEKSREYYLLTDRTFQVHRLTPLGRERAEGLKNHVDLRIDQVDSLPTELRFALSRTAHFEMLERSSFDLSSVREELRKQKDGLREVALTLGFSQPKPVLFSPFQSLSASDLENFFPTPAKDHAVRTNVSATVEPSGGRRSRRHLFVPPTIVTRTELTPKPHLDALIDELQRLRDEYVTLKSASTAFADSHRNDTQTQFYPLVTHLLQLLGFRSELSRVGVNYQRWDACVWLHRQAVPIEIKSPSEEEFLSTKAVRQAVENKVVLLSRRNYETTREVSSLIAGYRIPNERGDMSNLIDDIYSAYGFRIGVLDLPTLALLAMRATAESVSIDELQLSRLKGFFDV